MYLKSLSLKGFKSFADKSVLTLGPGITAIVGPNGSGKSNISDAVLWVLGERSARQLRGQSMEDIIFSGSSARRPVSVAEVELVLDNTDGTLLVDYSDVAIARRMYRNGTSEYLINGVVARRLDVLDILHDTGLGAGTHSIISQGNLDQILQSSPADRRSLIEEAAGVLKHKQRKEKSARKLERMNSHLARVRDVASEVNRQLAPLARKAKRAEAYKKANSRLSEVRLALAVDDLRRLQTQWEKILAEEKTIDHEALTRRTEADKAEQNVNAIQDHLRRVGADVGALANTQRRGMSVLERLESDRMLLREKRHAARDYCEHVNHSAHEIVARRQVALEEQKDALCALDAAQTANAQADTVVQEARDKHAQALALQREAEGDLTTIQTTMNQCGRARDEAQRRVRELEEKLARELARERLVSERLSEMNTRIEHAQEECVASRSASEALNSALQDLVVREDAARAEAKRAQKMREEALHQRDTARDKVRLLEAEQQALHQAQRASQRDNRALLWLVDNGKDFDTSIFSLAQALGAPADKETLVEQLLGDELKTFLVADSSAAQDVVAALFNAQCPGTVSLFMRAHAHITAHKTSGQTSVNSSRHVRAAGIAHALIDDLTYTPEAACVVEALLGDVVVCKNREEAFALHASDEKGLRFASLDGCVIYSSGLIRFFGAGADRHEGMLARKRRLDDLTRALDEAKRVLAAHEDDVSAAKERYRVVQEKALGLSQDLARERGAVAAAQADADRADNRLTRLTHELNDISTQHDTVKKTLSSLSPTVEEAKADASTCAAKHAESQRAYNESVESVTPLRKAVADAAEQLQQARLRQATLAERVASAQSLAASRKRALADIDNAATDTQARLVTKRIAQRRAGVLLDTLDALAQKLQFRLRILDETLSAAESRSSGLDASIDDARRAARTARDAYEEVSARLTENQVEKGRLEVQVEAALATITQDCNTPLDHAQQLPKLHDRPALEDEAFKLTRRIKTMGTINPDAAQEYAELKERADFLNAQLEDMQAAQQTLERIARLVDTRMKDDFIDTFHKVNENFAETFSLLFPGGSASLEFEDPDDMETTGVEVKAQPRGKRITKMTLMSGGEKSLTALALLFSIYRVRKAPFYILDEVEATLDDTNLRRLIGYLNSLRESTQLIMITHQRRTMEAANVLFGVSMQADGVTKVISQRLDQTLDAAD